MEKELILLRGIPGSGKSTIASLIGGKHVEADMYFQRETGYHFDPTKLGDAHRWCQGRVNLWMSQGEPKIVVSNTFTREGELRAYYDLATDWGYRVHSMIVENRHGGRNLHRVPEETIQKMKDRFSVKLI